MKDFNSLITDTREINIPTGSWPNARNILRTKGFKSISNEHGFKYKFLVVGKIIGVIETNTEAVIFSKRKSGKDEIGRVNIDNNVPIYKRVVLTYLFNFNLSNPIEGLFIYNYKKELIVSWCDGIKETSNNPKILNLDNPALELDSIGNIINEEEFDKLSLFPKVKEADIELEYLESGSIDGFVAYMTYSYIYDDNSSTSFFSSNILAYLGVGVDPVDKKGARLKFTNLDTNFNKIKLGIVVKKDGELTGYESYNIDYTGSTLNIDVTTLTNYLESSAENIVLEKIVFDKIESMTKYKNQVIVGNYTIPENISLQKYVNQLEVVPTKYLDVNNQIPSFLPDEVYALYLEVQYLNGTYSNAIHIPGRNSEGTEANDLSATLKSQYNLEWTENYKEFHVINNGRVSINGTPKMGYWENVETYPNTDDYNSSSVGGDDLRGTPIKYHRMPSMREFALNDNEDYTTNSNNLDQENFYKLGVKVTNFDEVIPNKIKEQIQGYRISFIKRNFGNSYVVGNWILTRRGEQDWVQAGVPLTWEYHDFNLNSVSDESHYGNLDINFSKARVLSNEIYKFKPSVDLTYLKTNYLININDADDKRFVTDNRLFAEIEKNLKYIPANNIAKNTQYHEEGVNLDLATNNYLRFFSGSSDNDSRFLVANVSVFSHKLNLYTGFKSNDLIIVGKTSNLISEQEFRGGDVFSSNEIDIVVHTAKSHRFTSSNRDVIWRYSTPIKIKGLFGPVNSSRLFNDKEVDTTVKTIGDNEEPDRIEISFLSSQDYDFEVKHEEDLSSLNDINTIITENILSTDFIDKFPHRIHRGIKIPKESLSSSALRTFLTDDYYEMANDKGEIIAVRGMDRALYIQHRFTLFVALIKDKLKTDSVDAYLGTPDLFDREPEEIASDDKGHIGSISKISCKIIKGHYITINAENGQIFMVKGTNSKNISAIGNRNWFYENWDIGLDYYRLDEDTGEKRRLDNPYNSIGYLIGYDEKYNRLLFTKKFYTLNRTDLLGNSITFDGEFYYLNGARLEFDNKDYFDNESRTFSFSLDYSSWTCEHDYFPNFYFYTSSKLFVATQNFRFGEQSTEIYETNDINTTGFYFKEYFESYVDLVFNSNSEKTKELQSIQFITEVEKETKVITTKIDKFLHDFIDAVIIYNNYQCSGRIDITEKNIFRNLEGDYNLNDFRDLAIDANIPCINRNGSLNLDNINYNRIWFEKSNFLGKFIIIRIIIDNSLNRVKYIHEVNIKSRLSSRN